MLKPLSDVGVRRRKVNCSRGDSSHQNRIYHHYGTLKTHFLRLSSTWFQLTSLRYNGLLALNDLSLSPPPPNNDWLIIQYLVAPTERYRRKHSEMHVWLREMEVWLEIFLGQRLFVMMLCYIPRFNIFLALIRHLSGQFPLISAFLTFFLIRLHPFSWAQNKHKARSRFQSSFRGLKRFWWAIIITLGRTLKRSLLHSFHATLINWFSLHVLSIRLINYISNFIYELGRYEMDGNTKWKGQDWTLECKKWRNFEKWKF